jgi:hypothetical protein
LNWFFNFLVTISFPKIDVTDYWIFLCFDLLNLFF